MGIYSRVLFPPGYDFMMDSEVKAAARTLQLGQVSADILENGCQVSADILENGCQLVLDIKSLVVEAGFEIIDMNEYYMADDPKTHGYMYQAIAKADVL
jgi:hypothetical protein